MNQELRQAAAQAKEALESIASMPVESDEWDAVEKYDECKAIAAAALSALSAVLEAPTDEAWSGSGVPARPTLPGEDERARFEAWFAANKHRFGMDEGEHGGPAWSAWIERAALAASPLPQEGRTPLTMAQLAVLARDAQIAYCLDKQPSYDVALARAVEAAHGIGTQGEQKP